MRDRSRRPDTAQSRSGNVPVGLCVDDDLLVAVIRIRGVHGLGFEAVPDLVTHLQLHAGRTDQPILKPRSRVA